MKSSSDIIVVGSHAPGLFMRVKRVPTAGETVLGWDYQEPMDGGKGSNQAIAAARLGARTSFVGCLGQDRLGEAGESWMKKEGIDLSFVQHSASNSTGIGFIILDEQAVPAMVTSLGANLDLECSHVEKALEAISGAKVLLTQFEILPEVALFAALQGRKRGLFTIVNPAPACPVPLDAFNVANLLLPNNVEAKSLLGYQPEDAVSPTQLAKDLYQKSGAGSVVITLGESGLVGADKDGTWLIPAPQVQAIDTSGAGDVFCAAMAVAIVYGKPVRSASQWACSVASISVTRIGTIPSFPTRDEVEACGS